MRKIITAGLAAATLVAGLGIGSTASAEERHHDHDRGAAVAAGIAGLAVGAAIAGSHPRYYYDEGGYYDRPYGYYYDRRCRSYTVWDPYAYAYVVRRRCW